MTVKAEPIITPTMANHVLWYFSHGDGFQPGGFFSAFYELAGRADSQNLAKLAEGFPAEVAAFKLGSQTIGGIEMLRTIAKIS